jgi:para-aminobenzoate synthetase component 1
MATSATEPRAQTVRPVVRALPPELGPLRALAAVEHDAHAVFLESGGPLGEGARWTILAFDPVRRLEVRGGALWEISGREAAAVPGDPMRALARAWPSRVAYDQDPLPASIPFVSGLAGFLSYDLKDHLERYPRSAGSESSLPDLSLGFYDVVWAWDRESGRGWAVSTGLAERDPRSREERAEARLARQWGRIVGAPAAAAASVEAASAAAAVRPAGARITSNFTRDGYLRVVERALDHIAAGDIYQVNLAQRFQVEPAPSAAALYRLLREESPAPFSSLVTTPEGGIVSSSPERFFRIDGDLIETRPIKGTRPRGASAAEDLAQARALAASAKDRAENVMIVDLERNDLGRICEIGSVRVSSLCEVSSYAHVHHLVSRVEGTLRADAGAVEILRAMFPGGSITGAPKIRAIQIIDALEPARRGAYTGAIGYWDASGACDFNIAIRTIVVEAGAASFHAGGGIVADSTPEGEYEETLVKARGMMRALSARWEG